MSGARGDAADEVELELEGPDAFDDPDALERLRANAFESVGLPYAEGILYGIGVAEGLVDALRVAHRFAGPLGGAPGHAGPGLQLLFSASGLTPDRRFTGALHGSVEATVHRKRYGNAHGADLPRDRRLLRRLVLGAVRRVRAGARARLRGRWRGERCGFTARPAAQWLEAGDAWAQGLLKYLDFEAMREGALKRLAAAGDEIEGDMMGAFDPLSPAVHVWGPVMVLPYSGAGDSIAALETIAADLGAGAIRVVVLDVTGARDRRGRGHGPPAHARRAGAPQPGDGAGRRLRRDRRALPGRLRAGSRARCARRTSARRSGSPSSSPPFT